MKISASIYSDARNNLSATIADLDAHQVDLLHVDCNDDLSVFDDIIALRKITDIPVDLHIITPTPSKFYARLLEVPVEYITFQLEPLQEPLNWPPAFKGSKGVAITTDTSIDAFEAHENCDFILIMATVPGQSGGTFNKDNFRKIRTFRKRYPNKSIHVDGGVNGEVSFILRNMGVSTAVSGSYLFKGPSIGNALMNLTARSHDSSYCVEDFMIPLEECPVASTENASTENILEIIENGKLGFCLVTKPDNQLEGIVSSADIRKALLHQLKTQEIITPKLLINPNPVTIQASDSVFTLLKLLKRTTFPVMYLPVISKDQKAVGILNFVNLIKGEL
ncbi:MAG: CBS domain-containing protein [Bacteroidetes bacterium]|nr:CBS domain-containing protein [Bacteroidota bacterium]MBM3424243.1 CBS domain-containing protein [Bacteroidota bacterium]